jgi:hypothetical protein
LQIAISAASGKSPSDEALWRTYCDGMRGAKMLTWSNGLRDDVGLGDEKADEVLADEGEEQEAEGVATIPAHVWDSVRHRPGLPCAILDVAELVSNSSEAAEAVQALIWGDVPPSKCTP